MSIKKSKGITKIAVKGFKSIGEACEIDIRPLTLLAGANSSGKSSIMQPLLLLKQTLEAPYDPGPLLIDGPNVRFTEAEQFLSTLDGERRTDRFQIQIEVHERNFFHSLQTIFKKGQNGIEIIKMISRERAAKQTSPSKPLILHPDMSPEEITKALDNRNPTSKEFDVVDRSRCFLYVKCQTDYEILYFTQDVAFNIFNTIHIPGLRGTPERAYKRTNTGPEYFGTFENYVASVIHEWQEMKDERLKTVANALHILGLTEHIRTKKIGDVGFELQVGRFLHDKTDTPDMVNIADVGFGVSQILPVVVALVNAKPGQLVYLEQPELHLHPRAQVALARVLADAAKRGVRVVAETHSSLLLLAVQTLVAEGDLSPELVKLHWFSRNKDEGTKVDSVDLDEMGAYGEWPMDFDDVSLHIQSRYLDAVDNVRFGNKESS